MQVDLTLIALTKYIIYQRFKGLPVLLHLFTFQLLKIKICWQKVFRIFALQQSFPNFNLCESYGLYKK